VRNWFVLKMTAFSLYSEEQKKESRMEEGPVAKLEARSAPIHTSHACACLTHASLDAM
jgi:hypothetical protein